jgi:hypothetical protein
LLLASTLAVAVAAGLAGCGGSEPSPTAVTSPVSLPTELVPSPSTTALPADPTAPVDSSTPDPDAGGTPSFEAFTVRAPLTCEPPTYPATVEWRARGATNATILVDGAQVAGPVPANGPFDLVLACDGTAHTVVLVLVGADGSSVLQTRAVLASPGS